MNRAWEERGEPSIANACNPLGDELPIPVCEIYANKIPMSWQIPAEDHLLSDNDLIVKHRTLGHPAARMRPL